MRDAGAEPLVAPGIATSNKGIATSSKDPTSSSWPTDLHKNPGKMFEGSMNVRHFSSHMD